MAPRVSLVMPREAQRVAGIQTTELFWQRRFLAMADPPGETAVRRWK
jgi:hypothetical protein